MKVEHKFVEALVILRDAYRSKTALSDCPLCECSNTGCADCPWVLFAPDELCESMIHLRLWPEKYPEAADKRAAQIDDWLAQIEK